MKSRTSPLYSVFAIFLCTALVVEPALAQVKVYVEDHQAEFDIRQQLPVWIERVESASEAEWILEYIITGKRQSKPWLKGFILGYLIGIPAFILLGTTIDYLQYGGEFIIPDLTDLTTSGKWIFFGVVGPLGGFAGASIVTSTSSPQIIKYFNIILTNTDTGLKNQISTNSEKARSDVEYALRKIAGDHYAPTLTISNLRAKTKHTIQNPTINAKVALSDDVGLSKIVFTINRQRNLVELNGDKSYVDTRPILLDVGENTVTISATDLYGRSLSKTFSIFRTRGPTVATSEEHPPATVYPPLLSINEMSFHDESADGFLDAGEGGILTFRVMNEGKGAAKDLIIEVKPQQGSGISVSPTDVPSMVSPGSSVQVKYSLIGSATVPTLTATLAFSAVDRSTDSPAAPVSTTIKTRGRWSDVDLDIPRARRPNRDGVAVIIGNRDYKDTGIYPVEFALTDAAAMKKYVMQALGFKEENVIYLQNASFSDLRSIFGTESDPQGKLHNLIFPDRSDVFIYYSGHGVPGLEDQRGYLLPANVKAEDAQKSGYSLELLGRNLAQLPAKSVTLVVDACFSGQSEEGLLIQDASPVYIEVTDPFVKISNGSSFFASTGKEMASWFPEQKHGLFTYYFLKGLQGEADANKDKRVTVAELEEYISETVPYKVRRLTGRSQHPVITATQKDRILARY